MVSALGAMLLAAMAGVAGQVADTRASAKRQTDLAREARFAMARLTRATRHAEQLLLPLADVPSTNWREHVREETVPPSPPEGSSTRATAVLAVSLDRTRDLDGDGVPDADNDGDGRFDEDPPGDRNFDLAPGIYLVDDGGNGLVDEGIGSSNGDDDEGNSVIDEDPVNGLDDDDDGLVDEDPAADANGDAAPGIAGVDDDRDGMVDEGGVADNDEDGQLGEDWVDSVVFYLEGDRLVERTPVPWDEDASGSVSGRDFVVSTLVEGVTRFRVERVPPVAERPVLVDLVLELASPEGESVSLHARVRVGGAP